MSGGSYGLSWYCSTSRFGPLFTPWSDNYLTNLLCFLTGFGTLFGPKGICFKQENMHKLEQRNSARHQPSRMYVLLSGSSPSCRQYLLCLLRFLRRIGPFFGPTGTCFKQENKHELEQCNSARQQPSNSSGMYVLLSRRLAWRLP